MTSKQKYTGIQKVTYTNKRGQLVQIEQDFDQIVIDGSNVNLQGYGYVGLAQKQFNLLAFQLLGVPKDRKATSTEHAKVRKLKAAIVKYYGTVVKPMTRGQFQQIIDNDSKAPKALMDLVQPVKSLKVQVKSTKAKSTPKLSAKQVTELVEDPDKLVAILKAAGLA
jgi:hypothetical protein